MISDTQFWIVTLGLGVGTFLIRFSFLGIFGSRELPDWMLLHLRYVGVAVFPALITPLVIWPDATGGVPDPARMIAALAAFIVGVKVSVVGAILTGMFTLYAVQFVMQSF